LISERTKAGLAAARARGRLLGRPKGSLGPSKLDGKEGEIQMLLGKRVSEVFWHRSGRYPDYLPVLAIQIFRWFFGLALASARR